MCGGSELGRGYKAGKQEEPDNFVIRSKEGRRITKA